MLLATLATMVGDLSAERLEAVFAQWAGLSLRDAHRAQAPASFQPLRAAIQYFWAGKNAVRPAISAGVHSNSGS
ncbi:MAG: hypothetical protein ILM98_01695 [Kiritimatiellae bacterium]|nr:hypothetical protein [Kiritimatiellia bacterium]